MKTVINTIPSHQSPQTTFKIPIRCFIPIVHNAEALSPAKRKSPGLTLKKSRRSSKPGVAWQRIARFWTRSRERASCTNQYIRTKLRREERLREMRISPHGRESRLACVRARAKAKVRARACVRGPCRALFRGRACCSSPHTLDIDSARRTLDKALLLCRWINYRAGKEGKKGKRFEENADWPYLILA